MFSTEPSRWPEFFEALLVAQGVHWLPEPMMKVGLDLLLGGEFLDWAALECSAFVGDFADDRRRKDKEAAVDPAAFALRLLLKGSDLGSFEAEAAEPGSGVNGRDRGQLPVALVEGDRSRDVHIANPVAIRHAESIFVFEITSDIAQAAAGA